MSVRPTDKTFAIEFRIHATLSLQGRTPKRKMGYLTLSNASLQLLQLMCGFESSMASKETEHFSPEILQYVKPDTVCTSREFHGCSYHPDEFFSFQGNPEMLQLNEGFGEFFNGFFYVVVGLYVSYA